MSKAHEDGGPAFPTRTTKLLVNRTDPKEVKEMVCDQCGMSLRDWFAAQAMAASVDIFYTVHGKEDLARHCYVQADAMLAERKQVRSEES